MPLNSSEIKKLIIKMLDNIEVRFSKRCLGNVAYDLVYKGKILHSFKETFIKSSGRFNWVILYKCVSYLEKNTNSVKILIRPLTLSLSSKWLYGCGYIGQLLNKTPTPDHAEIFAFRDSLLELPSLSMLRTRIKDQIANIKTTENPAAETVRKHTREHIEYMIGIAAKQKVSSQECIQTIKSEVYRNRASKLLEN